MIVEPLTLNRRKKRKGGEVDEHWVLTAYAPVSRCVCVHVFACVCVRRGGKNSFAIVGHARYFLPHTIRYHHRKTRSMSSCN